MTEYTFNTTSLNKFAKFHTQRGVTLFVTLVMLLALLALASSLAEMAILGEKAAHNDIDRQIALQAAESALVDAELDIEQSTSTTSRSQLFSPISAEGFIEGCGAGHNSIYQGLCINSADQQPTWKKVNLTDSGKSSPSVPFGRFTGRSMQIGEGSLPSLLPRYIIELLLDNSTGKSTTTTYVYRITAIGFGANPTTQVVLQSIYKKS